MSGAVLLSDTKSFVRSPTGAFVRGAAPAAPGSIVIASRDDGALVIDPETRLWGRLAAANPFRPTMLTYAGGVLYGATNQGVREYSPSPDTWNALPYQGEVSTLLTHNDELYHTTAWNLYRWTGSAWEFVSNYRPDQIVITRTFVNCTDQYYPVIDCGAAADDPAGEGSGILASVSAGGRIYLAGDHWSDWRQQSLPDPEGLNAHPIVDDLGNVIAIFTQPVSALYPFDDSRFYARVGRDSTGKVRWRDTYPGCCYTGYNNPDFPDHFELRESSPASNMMFVNTASVFDPDNVTEAFATQAHQPIIDTFDHGGGAPLAGLRYEPEALLITSPGHGLSVDDLIEIENTERYTLTPTNTPSRVLDVVNPDAFTVDKQFRGDEAGTWVGVQGTSGSGSITAFANGGAKPISGLYRWTGVDWIPALADRAHPEGLPGAYAAPTTVGPGYIGPVLLASDGAIYFATEGQADSLEISAPGLQFSKRLCFPALDLPTADRSNTVDDMIQLPAGATIGTADQSCPGDTVASRAVFGDTMSTFTFDDATQIPEWSSIEILTSTDPSYIGTWGVQRRFSAQDMRVDVPFSATASGTWQRAGNPGVNGTFSAVRLGTTYIYEYDIGTDPRPGDLIMTGASSGASIDLAGMGYDGSVDYLIGTGGVPVYGYRRVRSDRFGTPRTHYTLFVRLEYGDPVDPGWQVGETVNLSVS